MIAVDMLPIRKLILTLAVLAGVAAPVASASAQQRPPLTPAQRGCLLTQMGAGMLQSRSPYLAEGIGAGLRAAEAAYSYCINKYPAIVSKPTPVPVIVPKPTPVPVIVPKRTPVPVSADGHFYPKVTINGTLVRLMADTGATVVSLSAEDARKVGIDPQSLPFTDEAQTANGTVPSAGITLPEITIEGILLRDIRASCCTTGTSLLGMSALGRLSVEMQNGWMFLSRRN
jgi:clan AA aspartic protease (TIGR02281 family)